MSLESLETTEAEALPFAASQSPTPVTPTSLPAIGEHLPHLHGHYAGIAGDLEGGEPGHLVLLDALPLQDLNREDACTWALALGDGTRLPTKSEAALLWANVPNKLTPKWHWTKSEYNAAYAWLCDFGYGTFILSNKSYKGSSVAVRRLPFQYFNTLPGGAA